VDADGQPPSHLNQRLYDRETGRVVQDGLTQAVEIAKGWPTPVIAFRPDPDNLNSSGKPRVSLKLNPDWVSQLMGYPDGWLDDVWPDSKPSATRSSRKSRNS
jgi:hypothetical protein